MPEGWWRRLIGHGVEILLRRLGKHGERAMGMALALLAAALIWGWFDRKPVIESYEQAKYYLEEKVFYDHPYTLYCDVAYDEEKRISLPAGMESPGHSRRASRMEWEHIVPAVNFGVHFKEWREGHPECKVNGKKFYGRKCASLVNKAYRKIEADMFNLYPAIGAVNAARGSREYAILPDGENVFGQCGIKVKSKKFEPPDRAKGQIARSVLYMADRYSEVRLAPGKAVMYQKWSEAFPVQAWECQRVKRITKLQGNRNKFVEEPCKKARLW